MNNVVLLWIFAAVFIVVFADEKYTTKYDNINLDQILNNKRLLTGYTNCLLEKGPCSPDGAELKRVLPEGIQTNCAKCNEKQRTMAGKVLKHLIENEPEIWQQLEDKYDPTGTYRKQYKDDAKKSGINL